MENNDLRFETKADLENARDRLRTAFVMHEMVSYAVEFAGKKVTVLGYPRSKTECLPLAILLPPEEWEHVPHLTQDADLGPTKQWP